MKELIPIQEHSGKKAVDARLLHEFLGSKRDFSNWIKDRIKKYGFIENQDYVVFNNFGENSSGGRPLTQYALSLDCAKEISMVEGNAKGKEARQYFIACENKLKDIAKPLSQIEIIAQSAQILLEQDKRISDVESKVKEIEAKTTTRPDCFAIAGYASLYNMPVTIDQAKVLGTKAKALCRKLSIAITTIPDPRFGKVNVYPTSVLKEVFNLYYN